MRWKLERRRGQSLSPHFDLSAAMVAGLGYPSELADNDTIGHFGGTLNLLMAR